MTEKLTSEKTGVIPAPEKNEVIPKSEKNGVIPKSEKNGNPVSKNPGSKKLTALKPADEKLTAGIIISFLAGYIYVCDGPDWFWLIILVSLTVIAEIFFFDVKRSCESYIWFICLSMCVFSLSFRFTDPVYTEFDTEYNTIWDKWEVWMFAHFFAMWWVISRSGKQLDGQTGKYFLSDFFNGCIGRAFKNLFSRVGIIFSSVKSLFPVVICTAVAALFAIALALLNSADTGFSQLLHMIGGSLNIEDDILDVFLRIVVSLPIGAFIFGLIYGNARVSEEDIGARREKIDSRLLKLKKAPAGIFTIAIAAFSLVYLAFFIIQGSYLFGGFMRLLPEGFTVAHYARSGFFELCAIVAVNYTLLWMATRTVRPESEKSRPLFIACILLLAESLIFSAISFSKLYLYISCFGFTKLRLQSTWFTVVLATGSILWIWNLATGKPAFKKWMIFAALTLSVLTLF